jgi:hypothetical protein
VQVHTAHAFDRPSVRLNTVTPDDPFVVVEHGGTTVTAETVAECDAMIAAWTEAKRLLTGAQIREDGEALGRAKFRGES